MNDVKENRVETVQSAISASELDAQLVLIAENRRYVSSFTGEDGGFDESAGALLIARNDVYLLTDSRYTLQAQRECPHFNIVTYTKGLSKELPGVLAEIQANGTIHLGYEKRRISCELFDALQNEIQKAGMAVDLVGNTDAVEKFRAIKSESEIQAIKSALMLAEKAFTDVLETLSAGMMEIDAAWALEKQMRETGAQSVSFPVIVASGANAALPHATPGQDAIQTGKPLLFDWGARLNGYCSDISRTIVPGKPDAQFETIFNAVYDAQQKAIEAVRPGAYTMDIDAAARNVLKDKGLDRYFGHGLGHGVGLAIHEQPSLSPVAERNTRIEENMVFTIEPGVYIPDWGGVRLENMVVVRADGAEVLNQLPVRL